MVANEALLHNWFYGNIYVRELAAVVFAVLMGSVPVAQIFHWLFDDMDARIASTANATAPVVNTFKALIPVAIATHGGGTGIGLMAAVAVVAGHAYCPWRRFRGGTGVAVEFGALLGLCWPAGLIFLAVWLVAAVASNYAVVGSLLASAFTVVTLWYFLGAPAAFAGVAMLLVVASRFGGSFERLSEDREPTLRSANRTGAPPAAAPARSSVFVVDGQTVQRV
jgi:glycerol-3-phosphate acyltransferase PlsY